MLTTDAVPSWFAGIDAALQAAASIADTFDPPVPQLPAHLRTFALGVGEHGTAIHARYRELGDEAAKRLFPTSVDARS